MQRLCSEREVASPRGTNCHGEGLFFLDVLLDVHELLQGVIVKVREDGASMSGDRGHGQQRVVPLRQEEGLPELGLRMSRERWVAEEPGLLADRVEGFCFCLLAGFELEFVVQLNA